MTDAFIHCCCDLSNDIVLSEEDKLQNCFKDLTISNEQEIDDLCDSFTKDLNIKNKFQKVKNSNLILKFYEGDPCLYLINKANSTMRCYIIDNMFFIFNHNNFEFKKVDSIAKISDNKIILKLVFKLKSENIYDKKYTIPIKIHNYNEEVLIDNIIQ